MLIEAKCTHKDQKQHAATATTKNNNLQTHGRGRRKKFQVPSKALTSRRPKSKEVATAD